MVDPEAYEKWEAQRHPLVEKFYGSADEPEGKGSLHMLEVLDKQKLENLAKELREGIAIAEKMQNLSLKDELMGALDILLVNMSETEE